MSLLERHEKISQLFNEACDLDGPEREEFLTKACSGDLDLRAEIDSLLDHDQETSTLTPIARLVDDRPALESGTDLGRYHIVKLLGRGGMGHVFEAKEIESGRRVALKTISPAAARWTTTESFLREGQVAASLNHPNAVYVYGTEEINGRLLISMELMTGGTLSDRVRAEGPLPPAPAVDAMLDVMAGLSAALDVGILHRDVKPSNCFVDTDGRVKVGDFGISISSRLAQPADAHGTLGTPAFASPEQLRGEVVNVRSDIYSVGATLYYLLTGNSPFDQRDPARQIEAVLNDTPPPPRSLRPEVPARLEQIILRCLAKDPAKRFATYESLRDALRRFATATPRPARLGRRLTAFIIDACIVSSGITLVVGLSVLAPFGFGVPLFSAFLLYFGLLEGRRGATIGKDLLGLLVVDPDGAPIGPGRAFLRALLPAALVGIAWSLPWELSSFLGWFALALLFVTARRWNGLAAIHELLSTTRVVEAATTHRVEIPVEAITESPTLSPTGPTRKIGPYQVLEVLDCDEKRELLSAWDPLLHRRVWIVTVQPGSPPLSQARRWINRPTRLRWLAEQRSADQAWDAYEGPEGRPFTPSRGSWPTVLTLLLDVSDELTAGLADGTLPRSFRREQLWVTAAGRVKLLEFEAPGTAAVDESEPCWDLDEPGCATRMLTRVACLALEGDSASDPGVERRFEVRPPAVPLPLPARAVFDDLAAGTIGDGETLGRRLRDLIDGPHEVKRRRRAGYLVLLAMPASLINPLLLAAALFALTAGLVLGGGIVQAVLATAVLTLTAQSLVGPVFAAVFRGGLLMHFMGIAVVAADGSRITRIRALVRAAAGWWPVWALTVSVQVLQPTLQYVVYTLLVLGAVGVIWGSRSPQDWLVDTYLVPGGSRLSGGRVVWSLRGRKTRVRGTASHRWPAVATTAVLSGLIVLAAAVAFSGAFSPERIERHSLSPVLPSPDLHGGTVVLDLTGLARIEAAPVGESLTVKTSYDGNAYKLTESYEESAQTGWIYRIGLRQFRGGLQKSTAGRGQKSIAWEEDEIRIQLPRDVPLRLDLSIRGGVAIIDLAGLMIPEAKFVMYRGSVRIDVSEPLPVPIEHLEILVRTGGLQINSLGNASPRSTVLDMALGAVAVDLAGAWASDANVRLRCALGGVDFRLPAGAHAQGLGDPQGFYRLFGGARTGNRTKSSGSYAVDLATGTIDIDAELYGCGIGVFQNN